MRLQVVFAIAGAIAAYASPLKRSATPSSMMSSMTMTSMIPSGSAMMGTPSSMVSMSMTMTSMMPSASAMTGMNPSVPDILQYALTLEHLEATFYEQALANFSESDFESAGYGSWVRGRVNEIMMHEQSHVLLLTNALKAIGMEPNQACTYDFPVSTVREFLVFACGLENIGESAYLGALEYITEPAYVPVAGAITGVEARHQEFFYGPVLLQSGWTGPYDTPLGLDMVYTLVAPLITSCPSNNTALPVKSYGTLTVNGSEIFNAMGGETVMVSYANSSSSDMAVIYNGLGMAMVPVNNMMVTLPSAIQGYSYMVITTASNVSMVDMSNIVAGPAEIQTPFPPSASNPGFMDPFNSSPENGTSS